MKKNLFNNLFYRAYCVGKKSSFQGEEDDDYAVFFACLYLGMIAFVLICPVYKYIKRIVDVQVATPIIAILIEVISSIMAYLIFGRKKKYLLIAKIYSNESKTERVKGVLLLLICTIMSFAFSIIMIKYFH